jgi:hypothetical protein
MKITRIFTAAVLTLLATSLATAAPALQRDTIPTKTLHPAAAAPQGSSQQTSKDAPKTPHPTADSVTFQFDTSDSVKKRFGLGITSPGQVSVTIYWPANANITATLQQAPLGAVVGQTTAEAAKAFVSGTTRVTRLTFNLTPAHIQQGFLWTLALNSTPGTAGTVQVTHPKTDKAALDAYTAKFQEQFSKQVEQSNSQLLAKLRGDQKNRLTQLNTAKLTLSANGLQNLKTLANTNKTRRLTAIRQSEATPQMLQASKFTYNAAKTQSANTPVNGPLPSNSPTLLPTDPVVTSISAGPFGPSTMLTVNGSNFKNDDQVIFILQDGAEAPASRKVFVSSQLIQVWTPAYKSPKPFDGYFYFVAGNKRIDSATQVALKETVPTIASVTAESSGPINPGSNVLITGENFGSVPPQVQVIMDGAISYATISDPTLNDTQALIKIPESPQPFATAKRAKIVVVSSLGTSAPKEVTIAPILEESIVSMAEFDAELKGDYAGTLRYSEKLISLLAFDKNIYTTDTKENPKTLYANHLQSIIGNRGDDEFFLRTKLKNGWKIKDIIFQAASTGFAAAASKVDQRIGTDSLYVKVHWWADSFSSVTYHISYVIEGPKGISYK